MKKEEVKEKKEKWEPTNIHLQVGDILTSKKGFLMSGLTDKFQKCFRVKYLGKGMWEILGNKREYINVKELKIKELE